MRISDCSSDVCSSDLLLAPWRPLLRGAIPDAPSAIPEASSLEPVLKALRPLQVGVTLLAALLLVGVPALLWRYPHPLALLALTAAIYLVALLRSEEHTSELQSLMRISYAVFCLKNNTKYNRSLYHS